ncbi:MAG: hypothetical protein JEY94_06515 [Melioribacteraceae bacterium]|nr:hypothetical protein [Melioribacteraceae bacterium]
MKLYLTSIPIELRVKIKDFLHQSKINNTYLPSYKKKGPLPNLWLIGFTLVFILLLFVIHKWVLFYWLVSIGAILTFFIFNQSQSYYYWKQFGKDSVFFDSKYFVSIQNKFVNFLPLSSFKYSDIILSENGKDYLIRFHFDSISILQTIKNNNRERILKFQNALENYAQTVKQTNSHFDLNSTMSFSLAQKLSFYKNPILFSLFFTIVLFLWLPSRIDTNAFNNAKNLKTATSFRNYLAEDNNTIYRDEAREEINIIYDKYISKYSNVTYSSSPGAEAFVETLKYLRDKNIFNTSLQFVSNSLLNDFYSEQEEYKIIPVTHSFTDEKNNSRENAVFQTIQSSFGKIFPADIFSISDKIDNTFPKFEVNYIYKNNAESLYFQVKEENLPDTKRTWYYGIEIEWRFRIYLPNKNNAIYEFNLNSFPAHQFDSESFSPDAVYSNMAISAFHDFKNEFYEQFLKE